MKLQTFDLIYFRGKNHFEDDWHAELFSVSSSSMIS